MALAKWKIAVIVVAAVVAVVGISLAIYFGTKSESTEPPSTVCEGANDDGKCPEGTYAKQYVA